MNSQCLKEFEVENLGVPSQYFSIFFANNNQIFINY